MVLGLLFRRYNKKARLLKTARVFYTSGGCFVLRGKGLSLCVYIYMYIHVCIYMYICRKTSYVILGYLIGEQYINPNNYPYDYV